MRYPDEVHTGVRVAHIGTSSVRYEIGLFRNSEASACAEGSFVHVYVNRESRRPVPIAPAMRTFLASISSPVIRGFQNG
jgi:acyl-CoA thioester hydrolase